MSASQCAGTVRIGTFYAILAANPLMKGIPEMMTTRILKGMTHLLARLLTSRSGVRASYGAFLSSGHPQLNIDCDHAYEKLETDGFGETRWRHCACLALPHVSETLLGEPFAYIGPLGILCSTVSCCNLRQQVIWMPSHGLCR